MREQEVLDMLALRYRRARGNGGAIRYVGAQHVRFGPLWPRAIADFLVLDTWGNYGPENLRHPLLGFEVKVSRSDYLREVKEPGKSEPFRNVCSEWYMVVSDQRIVRNDLPQGWGLMIVRGSRLVCVRKSDTNQDPTPMPRGLTAGFLRAVATQYQNASSGVNDGLGRSLPPVSADDAPDESKDRQGAFPPVDPAPLDVQTETSRGETQ